MPYRVSVPLDHQYRRLHEEDLREQLYWMGSQDYNISWLLCRVRFGPTFLQNMGRERVTYLATKAAHVLQIKGVQRRSLDWGPWWVKQRIHIESGGLQRLDHIRDGVAIRWVAWSGLRRWTSRACQSSTDHLRLQKRWHNQLTQKAWRRRQERKMGWAPKDWSLDQLGQKWELGRINNTLLRLYVIWERRRC